MEKLAIQTTLKPKNNQVLNNMSEKFEFIIERDGKEITVIADAVLEYEPPQCIDVGFGDNYEITEGFQYVDFSNWQDTSGNPIELTIEEMKRAEEEYFWEMNGEY